MKTQFDPDFLDNIYGNGPRADEARLRRQLEEIQEKEERDRLDRLAESRAQELRRRIREKGHKPVCRV